MSKRLICNISGRIINENNDVVIFLLDNKNRNQSLPFFLTYTENKLVETAGYENINSIKYEIFLIGNKNEYDNIKNKNISDFIELILNGENKEYSFMVIDKNVYNSLTNQAIDENIDWRYKAIDYFKKTFHDKNKDIVQYALDSTSYLNYFIKEQKQSLEALSEKELNHYGKLKPKFGDLNFIEIFDNCFPDLEVNVDNYFKLDLFENKSSSTQYRVFYMKIILERDSEKNLIDASIDTHLFLKLLKDSDIEFEPFKIRRIRDKTYFTIQSAVNKSNLENIY